MVVIYFIISYLVGFVELIVDSLDFNNIGWEVIIIFRVLYTRYGVISNKMRFIFSVFKHCI